MVTETVEPMQLPLGRPGGHGKREHGEDAEKRRGMRCKRATMTIEVAKGRVAIWSMEPGDFCAGDKINGCQLTRVRDGVGE